MKDLGDSDLQAFLKANPNAVLDLWAPWCKPCLRIAPVLEQLEKDYAGKVALAKVNTDEHPNTLTRYGVMGLPAVLVFKNGQRVDQITGFMPPPELRARFDKALGL